MEKVFDNYVLLEKVASERVTKSGIKVPSSDEENRQKGVVVMLGSDVKKKVKKGETVIYSTEVLYQDKKYVIVKESELLAVVSK